MLKVWVIVVLLLRWVWELLLVGRHVNSEILSLSINSIATGENRHLSTIGLEWIATHHARLTSYRLRLVNKQRG